MLKKSKKTCEGRHPNQTSKISPRVIFFALSRTINCNIMTMQLLIRDKAKNFTCEDERKVVWSQASLNAASGQLTR